MAEKTVVAGSSVTAAQMKDLWRQIDDGSLTGDHMQALIEHRDPFLFERNKHGHITVKITGLDVKGEDEPARLRQSLVDVDKDAVQCFEHSDYATHRLVPRARYTIALVSATELGQEARTSGNLEKLGVETYGYYKPVAGILPRLREAVSTEQMIRLGLLCIIAPHRPINHEVLCMSCIDERCSLFTVSSGLQPYEDDAFAFIVGAQHDTRFRPRKK